MELVMSKIVNCQINRVKLTSFLSWFKAGISVFRQHFFKTALVTVILLALFALFLGLGMVFGESYLVRVIVAVAMSAIFPLLIGAQSISYYSLTATDFSWSLKNKFARLLRWNTVRLIVIYLLLALLISLGGQYLSLKNEQLIPLANLLVDVLLLGLQLVFFIALPINILSNGQIPPFKSLLLGIKAILFNFIPTIAFMFIFLLLLLVAVFIALPLTKFIGLYALIIYALEIALFLMFLGVCVAVMARDLVSLSD